MDDSNGTRWGRAAKIQPVPRSVLVLGVLLGLAGCPNTVSTQQPNPHDPSAGENEDEDGAADGAADGDASVIDARPPGPELPSGSLCDATADCGEGQICEGVGCEAGMGRCVSSERMCTRDCGCDGATFTGSGSIMGKWPGDVPKIASCTHPPCAPVGPDVL